jgi:hypothetical protein
MRPYLAVLLMALSAAIAVWLWTAEFGSETRGVTSSSGLPGFVGRTYEVDVVAPWQRPVAAFVAVGGIGLGGLLLRRRRGTGR